MNQPLKIGIAGLGTVGAGVVKLLAEHGRLLSLRGGRSSIAEAYITEDGGEAWLINADIPEYAGGNRFNHERKRPRKILLHKRQIGVLIGAIQREGRTVVPLQVYFNEQGRAKIEIALASGKQAHDKRQSIKDRDWQRQRARLLSHRR